MNYNDQILENKELNFVKKLISNIALAVCIVLVVCVVLAFGFHFRPYVVLSNSQSPIFYEGDMVVVKPQDSYKVGDIIKFQKGKKPITHRLVAIKEYKNTTYYICHGDAVDTCNPNAEVIVEPWQDVVEYLDTLSYTQIIDNDYVVQSQIDIMKIGNIEGKVVGIFKNYGRYYNFINDNKYLIIILLVGIWCLEYVLTTEFEIKKSRRLIN